MPLPATSSTVPTSVVPDRTRTRPVGTIPSLPLTAMSKVTVEPLTDPDRLVDVTVGCTVTGWDDELEVAKAAGFAGTYVAV